MNLTTLKAAVLGFAMAFVPLTASAEINADGLDQDCVTGLTFVKGMGQQVAAGKVSHSDAMAQIRVLLNIGGGYATAYAAQGAETFLTTVGAIMMLPAKEQAVMFDAVIPVACAMGV